jgi:hypothetical protein
MFGAPGVETTLSLSSHTPIKFLQFATNVFKLVCIGEYRITYAPLLTDLITWNADENEKLYLWDLTAHGEIKLEASMRFDRPVTSVYSRLMGDARC